LASWRYAACVASAGAKIGDLPNLRRMIAIGREGAGQRSSALLFTGSNMKSKVNRPPSHQGPDQPARQPSLMVRAPLVLKIAQALA
jgi:hypothetical protein